MSQGRSENALTGVQVKATATPAVLAGEFDIVLGWRLRVR
jgi:hypothetical protein